MPVFLGIELPEQFPPLPGDFDLRPRAVRDWIATLPLADMGACARAIGAVLRETSALELPAEARLGFLAELAPVLGQLGDQLAARLATEQFPLSAHAVHTAELLIDLQRESAVGYLCAAQTLAGEDNHEALAGALRKVLCTFGQMLLTAYQARLSQLAEGWRVCHRIYAFAEARGLDAVRELTGAYKQVLLLGAADPHRFRQQELTTLFRAFAPHVHEAELLPVAALPAGAAAGFVVDLGAGPGPAPHVREAELLPVAALPAAAAVVFVVDLEADHGPVRRELWGEGSRFGPQHRMLSLGGVRAALLDAVDPASETVIRTVAEYWTRAAVRVAGRTHREQGFDLLLGMTAVHSNLLAALPDREQLAGLFANARFVTDGEGGAVHPAAATPPAPQRWGSRDVSATGMRLRRSLAYDMQGLQVGALAGVREAGDGPWRLATVRWFRSDPSGRVEAGIELLPFERVAPVAVQFDSGGTLRALRVDSGAAAETPLLLLPGSRRAGQELTLIGTAIRTRVRIEPVPLRLPGFTLAGYAPAPEHEAEGGEPAVEAASA